VLPRKRILAFSLDCFKILAKTAENCKDIGKTSKPIEKQAKACEKYRRTEKEKAVTCPIQSGDFAVQSS